MHSCPGPRGLFLVMYCRLLLLLTCVGAKPVLGVHPPVPPCALMRPHVIDGTINAVHKQLGGNGLANDDAFQNPPPRYA
jgi:hypothetical protein